MADPLLNVSTVIDAPAARVVRAFFEHEALRAWWEVSRALTVPRVLGPYALQWDATDFADEVLGRLGGVFHGTVVEFQREEGFLVANAYWLAPDGDPIGPMAFEVTCRPAARRGSVDGPVKVTLCQQGYEQGARWRRYYEVVTPGYQRALASLKSLLEK